VNPDPLVLARRWADELPRDFTRRLAGALRAGSHELISLQDAAVLPSSATAVRLALELTASGDGPYTAGALAARLDAIAEQPAVTPVCTVKDHGNSPHAITEIPHPGSGLGAPVGWR
jgi:hypothetical protein